MPMRRPLLPSGPRPFSPGWVPVLLALATTLCVLVALLPRNGSTLSLLLPSPTSPAVRGAAMTAHPPIAAFSPASRLAPTSADTPAAHRSPVTAEPWSRFSAPQGTWAVSLLPLIGAAVGLAAGLMYAAHVAWDTRVTSKSTLRWVVAAAEGKEGGEQADDDWPTASTLAESMRKPPLPPQQESSAGAPPPPSAASATTEDPKAPAEVPPPEALGDLKARLYRSCAATSRGFGATSSDRKELRRIVDAIVATGAGEKQPTKGLVRAPMYPGTVEAEGPIIGTWQLLYTTARDVLVLEGNPLVQVQSIYQVIRSNGNITNIIDLGPRITSALPSPLGDTTLRQKVNIRGAARSPTRVGLTFDSVETQAVAALGQRLTSWPSLQVPLPKLPFLESRFGADSAEADSPGYFDVLYLDSDLLIVTQGTRSPQGLIVLTKRPDLDGQL